MFVILDCGLAAYHAVLFELSCRGKFAESVSDHVFRNIDVQEILSVVDVESMPNEVWDDHRSS